MTPQHLAPHEIPDDLDVTVVDHPLAAARLSTMRDARTDNADLPGRAAGADPDADLRGDPHPADRAGADPHPGRPDHGTRLPNPPLLVPVLRAGLGMADQAHALIPESQMGFVGLARDEETLLPTPYMESLPESLAGRPVFVLDPMLATGGSMVHTIELLTGRGATDVTAICALAAPEGLVTLRRGEAAGPGGDRLGGRAAQRLRLHRARAGRRRRPAVRRGVTGECCRTAATIPLGRSVLSAMVSATVRAATSDGATSPSRQAIPRPTADAGHRAATAAE